MTVSTNLTIRPSVLRMVVPLLFLALAGFGFFFRLWLTTFAPQPIIYDQVTYHNYAKAWYLAGVAASAFRTYGYPLFLLAVYKLAGLGNILAVYSVQALLDSATGFLLFFIARSVFRPNKIVPLFVLILYLINPYTGAYVGLLLTEVLATFLLVLFLAILIVLLRDPNLGVISLLSAFCAALVASAIAQVRPAFLTWSVLAVVITFFLAVTRRSSLRDFFTQFQRKLKIGLLLFSLVILGYSIPASYSISLNYRFFHQFSLTSVIGLWQEFYTGTFIKNFPAFIYQTSDYSPELPKVYGELLRIDFQASPAQRVAVQHSFAVRAVKTIIADPLDYAKWRLIKMFRMWDREKLFFYHEPGYQNHWQYFLWLNRLLVMLAIIGLYQQIKRPGTNQSFKFNLMAAFTIIISTLLFSLTHAESRLTIPLFPLVIFYDGAFLEYLLAKRNSVVRHRKLSSRKRT